MNNSKLLKLLTRLSPREQKQFEAFVLSSFATTNNKLIQLCQCLFDHYPRIREANLEKKKLYQTIFNQDGYQEKPMNNLISDLFLLLEEFLIYQHLQKKEKLKKRLLVEALIQRDDLYFVPGAIRKYERLIQKSNEQSIEAHFEAIAFHDLADQYAVVQGKRAYDRHLQDKSDALDLYYWCHKFSIACDMASRNVVTQSGYECHFWEDLIRHYHQNTRGLGDHPVLQIYYNTYQMLTDFDTPSHYFELKKLLKAHTDLFPALEINNIYKYLLNYCVRKINFGEEPFYREIHELYKILLEQKIIFQNGYLTQWTYLNIITAGIRLKEYAWTESFIYEYRNVLQPEERQNVFKYGLSALYFEKKDYLQALEYLNSVEFTDASYHLRAKILQLKSYFELGEEEALLSLIEAFQQYIRRSRSIPDYQKRANHHFLKLTKQLYKLSVQKKTTIRLVFEKKHQSIAEMLEKMEPVANKKWLKEKLTEMR